MLFRSISSKVETLNVKDKKSKLDSLSIEETLREIKTQKRSCYFPSAHFILIILEVIIFILTYVVPKGKYDCIKYDEDHDKLIRINYNKTSTPTEETLEATQETLDKLNITIKIENFKNGYVIDDVAIPRYI